MGETLISPLQEPRPTLGVILSTLLKEQAFLPGAAAAARNLGVNCVCFVGKNLNWKDNAESQANILYDLLDVSLFAGFVTWAGAGVGLGQQATEEQMQRFFGRLSSRPVVNYEKPVPGLVSVRTDTSISMEAVLRHLILAHNRRRIVLVRGPANHYETEERVRAYRNVLAEFEIPFNPLFLLPPVGWEQRDDEALISRFLEERGLQPDRDFDAVAGTESYLACAAIRVLQARGAAVPADVAVVGFNESPENIATIPPLTTVRKNFFYAGYRAVEILLDRIAGQRVPLDNLIPAEMVLRRSCGCMSQTIVDVEATGKPLVAPAKARKERLSFKEDAGHPEAAHLLEVLGREANSLAAQLPEDWAARLWASFESDMRRATRLGLIGTLNDLLNLNPLSEDTLIIWNRVLTRLRAEVRPLLEGPDLGHAEDLWQQARILLVETGLQVQYRLAVAAENRRVLLDDLNRGLGEVNDLDALVKTLAQALPRLGIPSGYLSLYDDPAQPQRSARLVMAYRDYQVVPLPPAGAYFPTHQIIPSHCLPQDRAYVLVVEPLYVRQRQLGLIVLELAEGDGTIFETIQRYVSSALDRLLIEQDFREREAQFQAMAESAPIGILLVTRDGAVTYQNPVSRQLTAFDAEQSGPKTWFASVHPQDFERVRQKWQDAVQSGRPFSDVACYLNPQGGQEWWDVRMAPVLLDQSILGYVGTTQDITERFQMEEALKTSEERYRLMVEAQSEGVGLVDPQGKFLFMNQAGETIFGVPPGTLVGRSLFDFLEEQQARTILARMTGRARGERDSYEITITRPDGEQRHMMITVAPSFDIHQKLVGSFGVFRDITERKQHEERLIYLSTRDMLTGLYNRAFFEETLERFKHGAQFPVSILVLDVDGLKKINDNLGHAAGDEMLRRLARVLKASFRTHDLIFRIGGDEFAVFIPHTPEGLLPAALERVGFHLSDENSSHQDFEIHISIGGATANEPGELDGAIRAADQAMYRQKLSGPSRLAETAPR